MFEQMAEETFLRACFVELEVLMENIHVLSQQPDSIYAAESPKFRTPTRFNRLLAGSDGAHSSPNPVPPVLGRHRLAILLNVHAIFLENCFSTINLKKGLGKLFQCLTLHGFERRGNLGYCHSLILNPRGGPASENPDRELWIMRIVSVVKPLSPVSLSQVSDLLFGYLVGNVYHAAEREALWDSKQLEKEIFGSRAKY